MPYLQNAREWAALKAKWAHLQLTEYDEGGFGISHDQHLQTVCAIVQATGIPKEEQKKIFRLLLPALFILHNETYLTYALENQSNVGLYLNGRQDQKNQLLRTNHGFSISLRSVRDYDDLKAQAIELNIALGLILDGQMMMLDEVFQHCRRYNRGCWQDIYQPLQVLFDRHAYFSSGSSSSASSSASDFSAASSSSQTLKPRIVFPKFQLPEQMPTFEEYQVRFRRSAFPEHLVPQRPSFADFPVFENFINALEHQQNGHLASVRRILWCLMYLVVNVDLITAAIKAGKPDIIYYNTSDKSPKNVIRAPQYLGYSLSFHLTYDKAHAEAFREDYLGMYESLSQGIQLAIDRGETSKLAHTFFHKEGICLDNALNPVMSYLAEMMSGIYTLESILAEWQNTLTEIEKNTLDGIYGLKCAYDYCKARCVRDGIQITCEGRTFTLKDVAVFLVDQLAYTDIEIGSEFLYAEILFYSIQEDHSCLALLSSTDKVALNAFFSQMNARLSHDRLLTWLESLSEKAYEWLLHERDSEGKTPFSSLLGGQRTIEEKVVIFYRVIEKLPEKIKEQAVFFGLSIDNFFTALSRENCEAIILEFGFENFSKALCFQDRPRYAVFDRLANQPVNVSLLIFLLSIVPLENIENAFKARNPRELPRFIEKCLNKPEVFASLIPHLGTLFEQLEARFHYKISPMLLSFCKPGCSETLLDKIAEIDPKSYLSLFLRYIDNSLLGYNPLTVKFLTALIHQSEFSLFFDYLDCLQLDIADKGFNNTAGETFLQQLIKKIGARQFMTFVDYMYSQENFSTSFFERALIQRNTKDDSVYLHTLLKLEEIDCCTEALFRDYNDKLLLDVCLMARDCDGNTPLMYQPALLTQDAVLAIVDSAIFFDKNNQGEALFNYLPEGLSIQQLQGIKGKLGDSVFNALIELPDGLDSTPLILLCQRYPIEVLFDGLIDPARFKLPDSKWSRSRRIFLALCRKNDFSAVVNFIDSLALDDAWQQIFFNEESTLSNSTLTSLLRDLPICADKLSEILDFYFEKFGEIRFSTWIENVSFYMFSLDFLEKIFEKFSCEGVLFHFLKVRQFVSIYLQADAREVFLGWLEKLTPEHREAAFNKNADIMKLSDKEKQDIQERLGITIYDAPAEVLQIVNAYNEISLHVLVKSYQVDKFRKALSLLPDQSDTAAKALLVHRNMYGYNVLDYALKSPESKSFKAIIDLALSPRFPGLFSRLCAYISRDRIYQLLQYQSSGAVLYLLNKMESAKVAHLFSGNIISRALKLAIDYQNDAVILKILACAPNSIDCSLAYNLILKHDEAALKWLSLRSNMADFSHYISSLPYRNTKKVQVAKALARSLCRFPNVALFQRLLNTRGYEELMPELIIRYKWGYLVRDFPFLEVMVQYYHQNPNKITCDVFSFLRDYLAFFDQASRKLLLQEVTPAVQIAEEVRAMLSEGYSSDELSRPLQRTYLSDPPPLDKNRLLIERGGGFVKGIVGRYQSDFARRLADPLHYRPPLRQVTTRGSHKCQLETGEVTRRARSVSSENKLFYTKATSTTLVPPHLRVKLYYPGVPHVLINGAICSVKAAFSHSAVTHDREWRGSQADAHRYQHLKWGALFPQHRGSAFKKRASYRSELTNEALLRIDPVAVQAIIVTSMAALNQAHDLLRELKKQPQFGPGLQLPIYFMDQTAGMLRLLEEGSKKASAASQLSR